MRIDHDYELTLTTTRSKKSKMCEVTDYTGGPCNDSSYTCTILLSQSIFVSVLHWLMCANHVDNYYHQQIFTCKIFADADTASHKTKIQ